MIKGTKNLISTTGTYTGDDTANRAIPHGLGRIPKLVIIQKKTIGAPYNYGFINNQTAQMFGLGGTNAVTAADATNFYVGNAASYQISCNGNAINYDWWAS